MPVYKLVKLALSLIILCFLACSIQAGKARTKRTEEAISKSVELQRLDKICRELPVTSTFQPLRKDISGHSHLFYYYQLEYRFDELKEIYTKELIKTGWELVKEEYSVGISEDSIKFKKQNYLVNIGYGNFGDANYTISCEDLENSK